jgi:hypothetical protein
MTVIDEKSDLVWGAAAIGRAIGRSERAVFHLLEKQLLPARRIGGRWCASRQRLLEHVIGDEKTEA